MSLTSSDLSVLAYANNFTLWHYRSGDADITTSGYFDNAADMLRVNDMIIANTDIDGTAMTDLYIITGNTAGAVSIAALA